MGKWVWHVPLEHSYIETRQNSKENLKTKTYSTLNFSFKTGRSNRDELSIFCNRKAGQSLSRLWPVCIKISYIQNCQTWKDPARDKLVRRGNAVILLDWSLGADAVYNYAQGKSSSSEFNLYVLFCWIYLCILLKLWVKHEIKLTVNTPISRHFSKYLEMVVFNPLPFN